MLFWISVLVGAVALIVVLGGIIYRMQAGRCRSTKRMDGKVVVITGASSGIGKYTALDLAKRGAHIILACRNLDKARNVAEWIIKESGNKNLLCLHLDLSDLDSVRKFAKQLCQRESKLDVLINNAGCGMNDRRESAQGFELTLATNHYAHFLLTHLLIHLLKAVPGSRIVNVSSVGHKFNYMDLDDLHFKRRKYIVFASYSQSKLANVLFTNELAVRLRDHGITANSLHPGTVATEIFNKENTWLGACFDVLTPLIGKTPEEGAQTSIHLAVSEEVADISGEYFVDCKISSRSKQGKDVVLARKLWDITEKEVDLSNDLKI